MPVTHGYCSLDDLREQLGDLAAGNLSERMLERAINAASRAVDNWCDRRFWQDTALVTQTIPAEQIRGDCYELWLEGQAAGDISTSTGLEIKTDTAGDGSYATTWLASDYRLWPYTANTPASEYGGWWKIVSTGRLRFDVRGARGVLPISITARFGWSFVPDGVEQATILKAAQLFKRKDSPYGVAQFGDIAAVQITRADKDVTELLWPYVRDVAMVA